MAAVNHISLAFDNTHKLLSNNIYKKIIKP